MGEPLPAQIAESLENLQFFRRALEAAGFEVRPKVPLNMRPPIRIVYRQAEGHIIVNEQLLIKGVPAGLLRHILAAGIDSSWREFQYFELQRKRDVFPIVRRVDNFKVRLTRLRRRLESHCPSLQVEVLGGGRFRVRTAVPVEFHVEEGGQHG